MLEVVDADDQVERVVEAELGDVTLLEAAVAQPGACSDLVGPVDQPGIAVDADDLRLGVPLGQLDS